MSSRSAPHIITSRLLILESKRLMLASLHRRLAESGHESLRRRAEALSQECEHAQHNYRASVLSFGSPHTADYWVVAYSRLIEMGNALTVKLRDARGELPLDERYQVASDAEMLEEIIGSWTASLRAAMASAAA